MEVVAKEVVLARSFILPTNSITVASSVNTLRSDDIIQVLFAGMKGIVRHYECCY